MTPSSRAPGGARSMRVMRDDLKAANRWESRFARMSIHDQVSNQGSWTSAGVRQHLIHRRVSPFDPLVSLIRAHERMLRERVLRRQDSTTTGAGSTLARSKGNQRTHTLHSLGMGVAQDRAGRPDPGHQHHDGIRRCAYWQLTYEKTKHDDCDSAKPPAVAAANEDDNRPFWHSARSENAPTTQFGPES